VLVCARLRGWGREANGAFWKKLINNTTRGRRITQRGGGAEGGEKAEKDTGEAEAVRVGAWSRHTMSHHHSMYDDVT